MLKRSLLIGIIIFGLGVMGAAIAQSPSAPSSPIKRTPVGKVEVPGSNYEVVTAIVELPAGFKLGRHTHHGSVMATILDGQLMVAVDGQPEKIYGPGQSLEVRNSVIHDEGAVGSKPAKLVVVYVVEKGKPLVEPAL
jgi:quercetin dioxygenase-like cupin family protein